MRSSSGTALHTGPSSVSPTVSTGRPAVAAVLAAAAGKAAAAQAPASPSLTQSTEDDMGPKGMTAVTATASSKQKTLSSFGDMRKKEQHGQGARLQG